MQLTLFVNVHRTSFGLEAHDGVWTSRADAVDAAEAYADTYAFTLTDAGTIDLTPEFSEAFHEKRDFDAAIDARNDELRELSSFTMTEGVWPCRISSPFSRPGPAMWWRAIR